MTQRHYFRCPDCLGVWAFDLEVAETAAGAGLRRSAEREAMAPAFEAGCPYGCGADTQPEHMGRVVVENLKRLDGTKPTCNASCTFARGPKCDCQCCAANHGQGVLATIGVYSDQGKLEARFQAAPKSLPQAKGRRDEWLQALDKLDSELAPLMVKLQELAEKRRTMYLDGVEWKVYHGLHRLQQDRARLRDKRTHQGRMKDAQALTQRAMQAGVR